MTPTAARGEDERTRSPDRRCTSHVISASDVRAKTAAPDPRTAEQRRWWYPAGKLAGRGTDVAIREHAATLARVDPPELMRHAVVEHEVAVDETDAARLLDPHRGR